MKEINIGHKLESFKEHLNLANKAVLSAKFGDGKTYFLEKFQEKYKDEYDFLTIYPVNYSVATNEDIFEYIKHDILLQLATRGLLNKVDLNAAINSIIDRELIMDALHFLLSFVPGGSVYEKLLEKVQKMKDNYKEKSNTIDKYKDKFTSQIGGLYESDGYTKMIKEAMKIVKQEDDNGKCKKAVLIIEDLDRLDPAHLFRIMNVFGAHIDVDSVNNKFDFDNIIYVLDYDTTEYIFKHFYGEKANYDGYISKFMSLYPFRYSLHVEAINNVFDYIENECGLSKVEARDLKINKDEWFGKFISDRSIRDIVSALDNIQDQYVIKTNDPNKPIRSEEKILRLLSLLKRLKAKLDMEIISEYIIGMDGVSGLNLLGNFLVPYLPPNGVINKGGKYINYQIDENTQGVRFVESNTGGNFNHHHPDIEKLMGFALKSAVECVKGLEDY